TPISPLFPYPPLFRSHVFGPHPVPRAHLAGIAARQAHGQAVAVADRLFPVQSIEIHAFLLLLPGCHRAASCHPVFETSLVVRGRSEEHTSELQSRENL